MQLSALTIKNFKGIGQEGARIVFAPITLLFGPNNAGKSTIMQALLLAKEVFCKRRGKFDNVPSVGSFEDYVHNHDLEREVQIGLEIALDGLPFRYEELGYENPTWAPQADAILKEVKNIGVEFSLGWNKNRKKPELTSYVIHVNGTYFTKINFKDGSLQLLNTAAFNSPELFPEVLKPLLNQDTSADPTEAVFISGLIKKRIPEIQAFLFSLPLSYFLPLLLFRFFKPLLAAIFYPERIFPIFFADTKVLREILANASDFSAEKSHAIIEALTLSPAKLVADLLENFTYLEPLRKIPDRQMKILSPKSYQDSDGLYMWERLSMARNNYLNNINSYLNGPDSLQTGYILKNIPFSFNRSPLRNFILKLELLRPKRVFT